MEERTYGSPKVVALVRRLFEEEKDESILPDDDPRKAEVEALDLLGYQYNVLSDCLRGAPGWAVEDAVKTLKYGGWL